MVIEPHLGLLEAILGQWKDAIGKDFTAYRNHVYRMIHFCFALRECSEGEKQKIIIAGAFHDIGIWSDSTIDYLPPSCARARQYLRDHKLEDWIPEVELMIDEHHKLRAFRDGRYPLVEVFRKADLVDVSLGLVKFGLPGSVVAEVKAAFPNSGFHKRLMGIAGEWFSKHPLSPPPFYKW